MRSWWRTSAASMSSGSMVTDPWYSRFAPVTVARWILDLSIVRCMVAIPSPDPFSGNCQLQVVEQARVAEAHRDRDHDRAADRLHRLKRRAVDHLGVVDAAARLARKLGAEQGAHRVGVALAAVDRAAGGLERAEEHGRGAAIF